MATRATDATPHKWVYCFGGGVTEGRAAMGALLGGKGANLAEMSTIGLPVPPGFTITTEVCAVYDANKRAWPDGLAEQVADALAAISDTMGMGFGDAGNPLLVAVRSGARVSMPGMMDTVLNLGLNDAATAALAERTDKLQRSLELFARHVMPHFRGHTATYREEWRCIQEAAANGGIELDIGDRPSNLQRR